MILWVVAVALIVVAGVGFGRMAWRIFRHDEAFEPGGSYHRQSFGRYEEPELEQDTKPE